MFYVPQNEMLPTDMQKSMELRKPPIYVISILVILWYILPARTQYYIENMMVVKPSMHLTLVVYVCIFYQASALLISITTSANFGM